MSVSQFRLRTSARGKRNRKRNRRTKEGESSCVMLRCESGGGKTACTTHRDLLAQEVHVFLAVAQALLCGTELVGEELFGFGDWVGEHDVGLAGEGGGLAVILPLLSVCSGLSSGVKVAGNATGDEGKMSEHTPSQR
jgi:hypothetical protein